MPPAAAAAAAAGSLPVRLSGWRDCV